MIKQIPALVVLTAICLFGQKKETKEMSQQEQRDLQESLSLGGSSPVEFIRALELHLKKYPESPRKLEMYRGIVKAAMETKDHRRVVQYGEKVLESDPNDVLLLQVVAGGLIKDEEKSGAERALRYATTLEKVVREKMKSDPEFKTSAQYAEEANTMLANAYNVQARATGVLGKYSEAAELARKGYELNSSADAAREASRWLLKSGKDEEAIRWLAEAFAVSDRKSTDPQRVRDRQKLGEMYRKLHGSEKGLGDLILEAYDRSSGLLAEKQKKMRELDPNSAAKDPLDFTISSLNGEKLNLATLKGKVVVMDFWATWCGPCRAQHPLYEELKERFAGEKNLVFLSINTDEDRSNVAPFLEENKWGKTVYFEDGLAAALRISSIPTAMVLSRKGEIVSRLNGFVADRFVDMMTERIREALHE